MIQELCVEKGRHRLLAVGLLEKTERYCTLFKSLAFGIECEQYANIPIINPL